ALDAPRPSLGLRALHRRRAPGFGRAVRMAAQPRGRAARRSGLANVLYTAAVPQSVASLRRSPAAMAARAEGAGEPPAAPRGRHGPPRAREAVSDDGRGDRARRADGAPVSARRAPRPRRPRTAAPKPPPTAKTRLVCDFG